MSSGQRRAGGADGGQTVRTTDELEADDSIDDLVRDAARVSAVERRPGGAHLSAGAALAGGRMQLRGCIGEGGMGVVYEAFDSERRSLVALKTLSHLDAAGIYRLKNEFRVLREVSHPNLVRLHELFADDGQWFFTMELVVGERFDRWVRPRGVLDEQRLRAALSQVVQAVRCIHASGKLHRDLKPSNVLIGPQGHATVLDFGLATDPHDRVGETVTERGLSGTPEYMAPEQAAGMAATAASDLYAIGVMLFEALTGRLPFEGRIGALLAAKQTQRAPSVRELCEAAPDDLSELCDGLLELDPGQRPDGELLERRLVPASGVVFDQRASSPPAIPPPTTALCGRRPELDGLQSAYAEARAGQPVVMFVSGESGIGKSTLVEAFLGELRREGRAVVLQGRCYERELVPFKAFDSLVDDLSRHLRRIGRDHALELMPREVFALARLFPVLDRVDVVRDAPRRGIPDAHELRRRAFVAFGELMARVSDRQPLVLYIDDLQWIDTDSCILLKHLLAASEPFPLLLLASYRNENAASNQLLAEVLWAAQRNPRFRTRELSLGPLSASATQQLAQSLLGVAPAELVAQIAAEAQGSPFFVLQLARQAQSGSAAPLTLDGCLAGRIEQLAPEARRLLCVLAIASRPLVEAVAVKAAQTDHGAIDRLRDEQLLRRAGGTGQPSLECYHDRIRETAAASLSPDALRSLHSDVMDALLDQTQADIEQLAFHCEGAGEHRRAAEFAERAGDAAHAALAFDRAAKLYRTALTCLEHSAEELLPLQLKLASALSDGGRGAEAAPLFMRAAAHVAPAEALELRRRAAEQWLVSGHTQEGLEAFREVLGAVGLRLPNSPRQALFDLLRLRFLLWLRGLSFTEHGEAEIAPASLLRIDACKTAWSLSFVSTIRAAAFQARHLLYALRAGEPNRIVLGLGMEAVYGSLSGSSSQARVSALQQAARKLVGRLNNPHAEAFTHLADGQCSYMLGRWEQACESLERAEDILVRRCHNVSFELNSTRFFWGNALVFRGCWRELGTRLQAWIGEAQWRGDLYASATLQLLRARSVTLAGGDASAAEREMKAALELWRPPEFGVQQFLAFVSLVQVDLYLGRPERARERIVELWPMFSKSLMSRIQVCRIPAHQHAAYVALAMAAASPADRRWLGLAREHARKLRRERVEWATGFALQIEAAVAHLRGRTAESIRTLEAAADTLERVNMRFYAAAVRWRLGQLIGGERGAALIADVQEVYRSQGVAHPDRLARKMTPGFSR